MIKINRHIEIVSSTSRGLSSMSQKSRIATLNILSRHYARVGITIVNDLDDLQALVRKAPDLVFLGMKYIPIATESDSDETAKIWLNEYLNEYGIASTGSSTSAHKLELNKALAKQHIIHTGLATSPYIVFKKTDTVASSKISLPYPLFVKPADRGGGIGVDSYSVVHNFEQLKAKVSSIARELGSDSLIEHYLPGREFSVALLKKEYTADYSIMPIELIAPQDDHGNKLLSGTVKSADSEKALEIHDQEIKTAVCDLAMNVFDALGARDYGRIDIRLDQNDMPQFLEANLIPSLISGYGSFPKACLLNQRLTYEPMILRIARLGLLRSSPTLAVPKPVRVPMLPANLLQASL